MQLQSCLRIEAMKGHPLSFPVKIRTLPHGTVRQHADFRLAAVFLSCGITCFV